jgi:hypothetical protein
MDASTTLSGSGVGPGSGSDTGDDPTTTGTPMTTSEDTSGEDTSSSDDGTPNCGEVDFVLEAIPPNVMLVLDKSGSMVSNTWDADDNPGTPEERRWKSLHDTVDFVVSAFDGEINFGANLFPSEQASNSLSEAACPVRNNVEVPVEPMNAANILAGIPGPNSDGADIQGATPATEGVSVALAHLKTLDPSVDRFMILITDGAANCGADADTSQCPPGGVMEGCGLMEEYDENLDDVVAAAFTDDEVPTYVIGIDIVDALQGDGPYDGQPSANTFVRLNEVAEAGGRPRMGNEKFYNTQNEIELMDALEDIAGQVVSCTVPLGEEPDHPNFLDIEIGGMTFERVDDCATEDGWVYVMPDGPYDTIELCGAACEALATAGELDATFGCPPPG